MTAKDLLRNYRYYKENYHSLVGQVLREDGLINRQYPQLAQNFSIDMPDFNTNVIKSTTESFAIKNAEVDNKIKRLNELNRIIIAIENAVSILPKKEKDIIKWKYFEGKDLNKITLMNRRNEVMSEKGVYFLHDKALDKLDIALKYIKIVDN